MTRRSLLAMLALALLVPAAVPAAGWARTQTFLSAGDTAVRSDRPGAAAGDAAVLVVRPRPAARAYLRFEASGLRGAVTRARLRIGFAAGRGATLEVREAADFRETALTWRRAPRPGALVAAPRRVRGSGTLSIDVTGAVRRDGAVAFVLLARRGTVTISAREHPGGAARLVVASRAADPQPEPPVRAIHYVADYPEAWRGVRATPAPGRYSTVGAGRAHVRALEYAGFEAAIAGWGGAGTRTHRRLGALLRAARSGSGRLRWAVAYQRARPARARIAADLRALDRGAGRDRSYLRVQGRPAVFARSCALARRLRQADPVGVWLVVRGECAGAGDRYAPAAVTRDPARFRAAVRRMRAQGARWQVVDSFNDWRRGTAAENADAWASASGFGTYLDILADPWAPAVALPAGADPVVAAAGDIACAPTDRSFNGGEGTRSACRQRATADVLAAGGYAAVLALGDLQYENGEASAFAASFDPSWGRVKELIRPAAGNHEYGVPEAADYFDYFLGRGAAEGTAGERGRGWYAFGVGEWRLIALSSNCGRVGGCGPGSPQYEWLREELRIHPARCTLAYWHHAAFTSGQHGNNTEVLPLFSALHAAGAELVLAGHDHDYERFAPQSPAGVAGASGIRQFVVGTGGVNRRGFPRVQPNSEVREADTFGVLELTLHGSGYHWAFKPEAGATFSDRGAGRCH